MGKSPHILRLARPRGLVPGPLFFNSGSLTMLKSKLRRTIRPAEHVQRTNAPTKDVAREVRDFAETDLIAEAFAPATEDATVAPPALLTPGQVAKILSVGTKTLERWRSIGDGPRFVKLSRGTVRYRATDLATYVVDCVRRNTLQ